MKKCPFCGGEASVWWRRTRLGAITFVKCDVCDAETKVFPYGQYDDCEVHHEDLGVIRALEAWNRRAK